MCVRACVRACVRENQPKPACKYTTRGSRVRASFRVSFIVHLGTVYGQFSVRLGYLWGSGDRVYRFHYSLGSKTAKRS